jgi:hypothetical protein
VLLSVSLLLIVAAIVGLVLFADRAAALGIPRPLDALYVLVVALIAGMTASLRHPALSASVGLLLFLATLWLAAVWQLEPLMGLARLVWVEGFLLKLEEAFPPSFRPVGYVTAGLPYWPQIIAMLLYALLLPVAAAGLRNFGTTKAEETEFADRHPYIDALGAGLRKPPVQAMVITFLVLITGIYVFPGTVFKLFGFNPGADRLATYLGTHAAIPVVAVIILMASMVAPFGRRGKRVDPVAADPAPALRKPKVRLMFDEFRKRQAVKYSAHLPRREDNRLSSQPFRTEIEEIPHLRGVVARRKSVNDVVRLSECFEALNGYDRHVTDPKGKVPPCLFVEDTLLDFKLIPLAMMAARHLELGRTVLIISAKRRLAGLKDRFGFALTDFLGQSSFVEGMDEPAIYSGAPRILYSEPATIIDRLTDGSQHPFFRDLGLVLVLDGHLLDVLELGRMRRALTRVQLSDGARLAQLVFQSEPVENQRAALSNTLLTDRERQESTIQTTLVTQPGAAQNVLVWDYSKSEREGFGKTGEALDVTDKPLFWPPARDWRQEGAPLQVIDEAGDEDRESWTGLKQSSLESSNFEVNPIGRYLAHGSYIGWENAGFVERDNGNLASALVRDVAAPGKGESLIQILSDPVPAREMILARVRAKQGSEIGFEDQKTLVTGYLPALPDTVKGIREMLQEIATEFLVTPDGVDARVLLGIVQGCLMRFDQMEFRFGANGNETGDDLKHVVSAEQLNRLFERVGGMRPFSGKHPLDHPEESHRVVCDDLRGMYRVAFGEGLRARGIPDFVLPRVDYGQSYHRDARISYNGQLFNISAVEPGLGTFSAAVVRSDAGIDGRRKWVFGKAYALSGAKPGQPHLTRHLGSCFLLADFTRTVRFKAEQARIEPGSKARPSQITPPIRHDGKLAEGVYLRLPAGKSGQVEQVAKALCLSLMDIIDLKFPAVAHRVAVLSPQVSGQHSLDSSFEEIRLCRLEHAHEDVIGMLRNHVADPSEKSVPSQQWIDLLLIEDSDGTLGVADALDKAIRAPGSLGTGSLFALWREHLGMFKQEGSTAMPDWSGARETLAKAEV